MALWLTERIDLDNVDQYVSCEIPDPVTQRRLYDLVTKHQLHTCSQRCCESGGGSCQRRFPFPYAGSTTQLHNDSRFMHRRRSPEDGGNTFEHPRSHTRITNANVVAYNPYLLDLLNAHVNVEVCRSAKAIQYLFKYVFKGVDYARIQISPADSHDETKQYLAGRLVVAVSKQTTACA